jgi:hypothetical protein
LDVGKHLTTFILFLNTRELHVISLRRKITEIEKDLSLNAPQHTHPVHYITACQAFKRPDHPWPDYE